MKKTGEINYFEIIKKSWEIVKNNKYLLWFGFFIALGSGGGFNFDWNNRRDEKLLLENKEVIENFVSQNIQWIILAVVAILILAIFFYVLGIRGRAALIKSSELIENKKECNFKIGFREGKKYLWRIIGVNMLLSLFTVFVFLALFFPIFFLFYFKLIAAGIIGSLAAMIIFFVTAVMVSFVSEYAKIYIVLSDLKIRSALENSYQLFRKNIISGIIMAAILMLIRIAIFIATLLIFAFLAIPSSAVYFFAAKIFFWIGAVLGIIIFFVFSILIFATYEAFQQIAWILFFKNIASQEEKLVEKESEEQLKESLPYPEKIS